MPSEFYLAKEKRPGVEEEDIDDPVWVFDRKSTREVVMLGSQVHFEVKSKGGCRCFRLPQNFEDVMGLDSLKPGTCAKFSLKRSKQCR